MVCSMQYYRIKLNLAIPLSDNKNKTIRERIIDLNPDLGKNISVTIQGKPTQKKQVISHFQDVLKCLTKYAKTINENDPRKEKSFAQTHICKHEEGLPCTDIIDLQKRDIK